MVSADDHIYMIMESLFDGRRFTITKDGELRECRQFKNIGLQASFSVIPEKTGNQNPVAGKYALAANGLWIPAFAEMTVNMTTLPSTTVADSSW